jgi:pilus assembly protein Flp/PilA
VAARVHTTNGMLAPGRGNPCFDRADGDPGRAGDKQEVTTTMTNVLRALDTLVRDEEGASLVEYILLVALIAVVCIAAVTLLGRSARDKFGVTANSINTAGN